MPEHNYVTKFVREQLLVLNAIGDVLPVWRHLILRTETFFRIVRSTPNLSLKNAVVFCLSSATLITASLVSLDKLIEAISNHFYKNQHYEHLDILSEALIEAGVFGYFILLGAISALATFIPARIISQEVSFRRLLIGNLYMSTFLQSINAILILLLMLILMFSKYRVSFIEVDEAKVPFGEPELKEGYALWTWIGISWLWSKIAAPTLSLTAAASMTGISGKRLFAISILLLIGGLASVLLISFIVHMILGKQA